MSTTHFFNGSIVTPHKILDRHHVSVKGDRIVAVDQVEFAGTSANTVDLQGGYLVPGYIDLHIHGGGGHDFMDCTEEAFRAVCHSHAKHGTTALLATSTVGRHEDHISFLELTRRLQNQPIGGARIAGAHFYGPYFSEEAVGCHPEEGLRPPEPEQYAVYLDFNCIRRATVAPELPGAERFVRECRRRGIGCNVGHSVATFEQMEAAVGWGITHADHLYCAMSDRARLIATQNFPMRAGVMEATFYFDTMTTEVIADTKHLSPDLLKFAYKFLGPDRLALVTDTSRALDMPDGPYIFGPKSYGEPILKRDGVGLMADGSGLASGVVGMDFAVRTFFRQTGVPLVDVIRMASLTPARIAGIDNETGSITEGKLADLVVLDRDLNVQCVFVAGQPIAM